MQGIEIYNALSKPPKDALREIKGGDIKGFTDINPQWRYKAMTEVFGLVGIGWKYEIQKLWTEQGAKDETLCFAQVAVYVRNQETKEWSDPIVGIGGSKLINAFSTGQKSNDEGFKMAVTDAFSTSLKMLGVAAEIYAGHWDGSKYADQNTQSCRVPTNKPVSQPKAPSLPGGADTEEEHKELINLMFARRTNGDLYFADDEREMFSDMRQHKTAQELIAYIRKQLDGKKNCEPELAVAVPIF